MTVSASPAPNLASQLVNGILAIRPLANLAKNRARQMMIKRAEAIGVDWTKEVESLKSRDWSTELAAVQNLNLKYPDYYVTSFHAYKEGNLGWEPALEVEVAAHAVHARIWQEAGVQGDARLRQSYHDILKAKLPEAPKDIVDLGCSVGMSTFAMQATYPHANITGVDLSPYFLAVAHYRTQNREQGKSYGVQERFLPLPATSLPTPHWLHAPAESTGLPDASFDLVSAFLIFHELPQRAAVAILKEARRILRPGGHFALMDMNPRSEIYARMPPYILTLLKSTEPYLDEYFALDLEQALVDAGFEQPTVISNSPRHRTVVAAVRC
ncbi:MAG: class I SAM-dependent methyltransferase [Leptolyngbyaceae cyanobacterium HOT.MB2.61]|jgi:SAM-dependent methyltransferase|nr:class I SAM-dependent methyltransferase [Leptolyngbyaceae cyanobacterium HOT.MB2.61]